MVSRFATLSLSYQVFPQLPNLIIIHGGPARPLFCIRFKRSYGRVYVLDRRQKLFESTAAPSGLATRWFCRCRQRTLF